MMTPIQEAADEAKKLAKMFRAVLTISDVFDSIASVENYANEVEGRLAKAKGLEAAEIAKCDAIAGVASKIMDEAREQSVSIIDEAKRESVKIRADAAKVKLDMAALLSDSKNILNQAASRKLGMEQELELVRATIKERRLELEVLDKNIMAAKDTIKQMLGS